MAIDRKDIIQILRDENELLKARNKQTSRKLARLQQSLRVMNRLCAKTRVLPEVFSSPEDLPGLLNDLLGMVLHAGDIDNGSLLLIDEAASELEFVAVIGKSREYLLNHRIAAKVGVVGNVVSTNQAILIEDVRASRSWSREIDERLNFHTLSLMCVPLVIDNKTVGAIEVVNQIEDAPFDENDLNVLKVTTLLVGIALEKIEEITLALGD